MKHGTLTCAGSMLGQRRRRGTNIKTAQGIYVAFFRYVFRYVYVHNKLSYPRARSAIPCFIEHSVQLF